MVTQGKEFAREANYTSEISWKNRHTRSKMMSLVAVLESRRSRIAHEGALVIYAEIPDYQKIPLKDLERSVLRNVSRVIQTLLEERVPAAQEIHETSVASARYEQGLSIDACIQAYRISLREIRDVVVDVARELAIHPDDINKVIYILWDTTDVITQELSRVHHETLVEQSIYDERQRTEFIQGVLHGSIKLPRMRMLASLYRIELDSNYFVIQGRPSGKVGLSAFLQAIEVAGSSSDQRAMLCTFEDTIVGLLATQPQIPMHLGIVGVGSKVPISSAPESFQEASHFLEVASRLGQSGSIDRASLSWRMALVTEPEIGDLLVDRYLRPLWEAGDFGTVILESLREYLMCGRHLTQAARNLYVHVNTLRYRIERFESMTGKRVNDGDVMLELQWAIERAELVNERANKVAITTTMVATSI